MKVYEINSHKRQLKIDYAGVQSINNVFHIVMTDYNELYIIEVV
jgi:hypothetical protein